MIPLPQLRLYIVAAALAAGLLAGFAGGWQVQGWRLGKQAATEAAERGRATIRALDRAADETTALQKEKDRAIAASNHRAQAHRRAADAARDELGGLLNDISAGRDRGPGNPACAPAAERADTAAELFGSCAAALVDLAGKADRHANDARTLMDAWPSH